MNDERGINLEQRLRKQSTSLAVMENHSNYNHYTTIMDTNANGEERNFHEFSHPTGIFETSHLDAVDSDDSEDSETELGTYHEDIDLYDADLRLMDMKLLNRHLKRKGIVKKSKRDEELRKRRRTLSNREYASSSRDKWLRETEELERANKELEMEIVKHKSFEELQEEEKELKHVINFLMGLDN